MLCSRRRRVVRVDGASRKNVGKQPQHDTAGETCRIVLRGCQRRSKFGLDTPSAECLLSSAKLGEPPDNAGETIPGLDTEERVQQLDDVLLLRSHWPAVQQRKKAVDQIVSVLKLTAIYIRGRQLGGEFGKKHPALGPLGSMPAGRRATSRRRTSMR